MSSVADCGARGRQHLEVAATILEPDQVRAIGGKPRRGGGSKAAVRAVVDDDAELRGVADRRDVRTQAFLRGLDQIGRHQEEPVGAEPLRLACILDRRACAVAGAGDDGRAPTAGFHRRVDDSAEFRGRQREEFACATRHEQRRRRVAGEPFEPPGAGRRIELAARIEIGEWEGKHPAWDGGFQFLRRHGALFLFARWRL